MIILVIISLGLVVLGLEEISWGQRLLGWSTPEAFMGNIQKETNFHNYFNEYFASVYYLFTFLLLIINGISSWISVKQKHTFFTWVVFPHYSMIGIVLVIFIASEAELIEELVSVFSVFYALRLWRVSSFEKKYSISEKKRNVS